MTPSLFALLVIFLLVVTGFLFFALKAARRKVQRDDELSQMAYSRGWVYSISTDPAAGFKLSSKTSAKPPWQIEVCCGEEGGHSSWSSGSWQSGERFAAILPLSTYALFAGDEGLVRLQVMDRLSRWQRGESSILIKIIPQGKLILLGTPDFQRSYVVIANDAALASALFSEKVETALLSWLKPAGDADKIQVFASDKGIQVDFADTADLSRIDRMVSLGLTCLVGLSSMLESVVQQRMDR
jgi:hypothetical protein